MVSAMITLAFIQVWLFRLLTEANEQVFDEIVQPLAFRWFDFDSDEGFS